MIGDCDRKYPSRSTASLLLATAIPSAPGEPGELGKVETGNLKVARLGTGVNWYTFATQLIAKEQLAVAVSCFIASS